MKITVRSKINSKNKTAAKGIVIPRAILEDAGIFPWTDVNITISNRCITLEPCSNTTEDKLQASLNNKLFGNLDRNTERLLRELNIISPAVTKNDKKNINN